MAVMFEVPVANVKKVNTKFVCNECGARYGKPTHNGDCRTCDGYGIDPGDNPLGEFAFLVSEADAIIILHDLLNYGSTEKPYWRGELSPDDVLIRLSLADFHIQNIVNPMFSFGYDVEIEDGVDIRVTPKVKTEPPSEATLRKYVEKLTTFAEKAIEIGEDITYKTR